MLAVAALALAGNWPTAAKLMVAERTERAVSRPAVESMLSHASQSIGQGWVFGLNEALDQTGATRDPLITAFVPYRRGGYHHAFAVLLVSALLCQVVLSVAFLLHRRPQELESGSPRPQVGRGFPRAYWLYLIAGALIAAGFADFSLIAFQFQKTGTVPQDIVPRFYAAAMATGALAALILGKLLDKMSLPVLLMAFAIPAFFAPLVFRHTAGLEFLGMVLWGMGLGAQDSCLKATLSAIIPSRRRSTAFGVFDTGFGSAWFFGSAVMGLLYSKSIPTLETFSVVLQLLALTVLALARKCRLPLFLLAFVVVSAVLALPSPLNAQTPAPAQASAQTPAAQDVSRDFRTGERCFGCHNNMKTAKGDDVSIGFQWRASIMANAARDPYWRGSVRRETIDHPESSAAIQNDCARCHAPAQNQQDKMLGRETELFNHLDFTLGHWENAATADGVTCSVCHQIQATGLNSPTTYNGNFSVAPHGTEERPVFGPFSVDPTRVTPMHIVSAGSVPVQSDHIRQAGLCGSCHTLYSVSLGSGGKQLAKFPEQMPYLEWQHSNYRDKQTCQDCHMPEVKGPVSLAQLLADPRDGVHRHPFTGANFLMQDMLKAHREDLGVAARPDELTDASARTTTFLQSQAARVTVREQKLSDSKLTFAVRVENLTGHKLPTAYPSRRAWLHVVVTAADGHIIFESGKLNPDGSIVGNANDADPSRFTPHFTRITRPDQVEIFEPILGDFENHVTTGLLNATHYLKDNRILPAGFDKSTASPDIAVHGEAATDPDFIAGSSTTHYAIDAAGAGGSFHVAAELIYQPVGFRWAHNLALYKADEPQRFVNYYDQAAAQSAATLAHAEAAIGDH